LSTLLSSLIGEVVELMFDVGTSATVCNKLADEDTASDGGVVSRASFSDRYGLQFLNEF
jgi:hypothetical protein